MYENTSTLATQITPNADLITATAPAVPRYVISTTKPVSITFAKGVPNSSGNFVDEHNNVIKKLVPNRDITGTYTKLGFDSNNKLIGQMPNQNVNVTYNYVPNPAFSNTVSVKYQDSDGTDITQKVIDKLGSAISSTVPTTANVLYKDVVGTAPNTQTYISVKMNTTSTAINIPVPVLTGYKTNPAPEFVAQDSSTWSDSYRRVQGKC